MLYVMNKFIIIGVVAFVFLLLIGGVGFWGYTQYSELSQFKKLGSYGEMQQYSQENFDLKKENTKLLRDREAIQKGFADYRKTLVAKAEHRSERRVDTDMASFSPLSGPFVLAATSIQEQLELCQDVQELLALEAELFQSADAAVMMQKDKICGTYIERKLIPLFKYQMLRVRASMSGSLGHLRTDAEQKFEGAKNLLERWQIPVDRELDSYTRFDR